MPKANLNPADAHRKALRKKELKKNKAERQKTREFALVKKDTGDLEDEIAQLEAVSEPSAVQKARLSELKSELDSINKKKEDYVEAHPEQRRLVYASARRREQTLRDSQTEAAPVERQKRNLFHKNGLPRHPERSVYYDPVMNAFGVPPPGMPYAERGLLPGEVSSDEEAEVGEDDDDVIMPEGSPPGDISNADDGAEQDSDDDIPLPDGPPPPQAFASSSFTTLPPLPPGGPPLPSSGPPNFYPPLPLPARLSGRPPVPGPAIPPPPPGMPIPPQGMPIHPPPPGIPHPPPPLGFPKGYPPPPGAFPPFPPPPPAGFLGPAFPRPPPGFFPRTQSIAATQDPLSSIPHQTYQAHRAARLSAPASAGLPPKPAVAPSVTATVIAAPQLRDFKKESTAFVPAALKRKKPGVGTGGARVNAAPALSKSAGDVEDGDSTAHPVRPDLLGALKQRFGPAPTVPSSEDMTNRRKVEAAVNKPKDDYEKFMDEMGDILGSSK